MSRNSDAKKARRRKRQAAWGSTWVPAADEGSAELTDAVAAIDNWLAARGWLLDAENSGDVLVSWVYPPSAEELEDAEREPVTRIWIALEEDDEEVTLDFSALLVGMGQSDRPYSLDAQRLAEQIAAVESYRPGLPRPRWV